MAPPNVRSPANRSHGGEAPQCDLAGWPINPDSTEPVLDIKHAMCSANSGYRRGLRARSLNSPLMGGCGMITEREVYDGLRLIGVIRERDDGSFVAVIDEQVLGPFDTPRQATESLLELPRPESGR